MRRALGTHARGGCAAALLVALAASDASARGQSGREPIPPAPLVGAVGFALAPPLSAEGLGHLAGPAGGWQPPAGEATGWERAPVAPGASSVVPEPSALSLLLLGGALGLGGLWRSRRA
jgi:hypothetical protein